MGTPFKSKLPPEMPPKVNAEVVVWLKLLCKIGGRKPSVGAISVGLTNSVGCGVGVNAMVGSAFGSTSGVDGNGVLMIPRSSPPGVAVISVGVTGNVAGANVRVADAIGTGVQVGGICESMNSASCVGLSVAVKVGGGGNVDVKVGVSVGVSDGGGVLVGVKVAVGVSVGTMRGVSDGVMVKVAVAEDVAVAVKVGVLLAVIVGVKVG